MVPPCRNFARIATCLVVWAISITAFPKSLLSLNSAFQCGRIAEDRFFILNRLNSTILITEPKAKKLKLKIPLQINFLSYGPGTNWHFASQDGLFRLDASGDLVNIFPRTNVQIASAGRGPTVTCYDTKSIFKFNLQKQTNEWKYSISKPLGRPVYDDEEYNIFLGASGPILSICSAQGIIQKPLPREWGEPILVGRQKSGVIITFLDKILLFNIASGILEDSFPLSLSTSTFLEIGPKANVVVICNSQGGRVFFLANSELSERWTFKDCFSSIWRISETALLFSNKDKSIIFDENRRDHRKEIPYTLLNLCHAHRAGYFIEEKGADLLFYEAEFENDSIQEIYTLKVKDAVF